MLHPDQSPNHLHGESGDVERSSQNKFGGELCEQYCSPLSSSCELCLAFVDLCIHIALWPMLLQDHHRSAFVFVGMGYNSLYPKTGPHTPKGCAEYLQEAHCIIFHAAAHLIQQRFTKWQLSWSSFTEVCQWGSKMNCQCYWSIVAAGIGCPGAHLPSVMSLSSSPFFASISCLYTHIFAVFVVPL